MFRGLKASVTNIIDTFHDFNRKYRYQCVVFEAPQAHVVVDRFREYGTLDRITITTSGEIFTLSSDYDNDQGGSVSVRKEISSEDNTADFEVTFFANLATDYPDIVRSCSSKPTPMGAVEGASETIREIGPLLTNVAALGKIVNQETR